METRAIELPPELESLSIAARFTDEAIAEILGDSPPAQLGYNLSLAVSEALTNAIRHCRTGKHVRLEFSWDQRQAIISVMDQCAPFSLTDVAAPDFEHAAEGGYGIYIIKSLMDEVYIESIPGGKCLKMVKRLDEGKA
jgi:serine/threonine-protein kinase RsbW